MHIDGASLLPNTSPDLPVLKKYVAVQDLKYNMQHDERSKKPAEKGLEYFMRKAVNLTAPGANLADFERW